MCNLNGHYDKVSQLLRDRYENSRYIGWSVKFTIKPYLSSVTAYALKPG